MAGLSCANPGLENEVLAMPVESKEPISFMENREYSLAEDSLRLDALKRFYEDSVNPEIFEKYSEDNLVLVKTRDYMAHGYMIDDSGLVLTVEHMAKSVNQNGNFNGVVITSDGTEYPIRSTELSNEFIDYAILVAETGKESKTHPLNFVDSSIPLCELDASFFTYGSLDVNNLRLHGEGYVLCIEHALPVLQNLDMEHKGIYLEYLLRRGSSFVSKTMHHGDSGAPVFSNLQGDNPLFLGLARATLNEEGKEPLDFGIITSSSDIIYSLKFYLDDLDSP